MQQIQKELLTIIAFFGLQHLMAQPYIDPVNIRYTYAFHHNNKVNNATPFSHVYIGPDFPFKMRKNKLIVLSPFYDRWNIDSVSNKDYLPAVSSIGLAFTHILPLDKNHWTLNMTVIPRINSESLSFDNSFQIGGVLLATYKKSATLKYKFGVYINNEFFGVFVMPLLGIDWRINERNNLFGTLPGRLTYEHKLNSHFYTGATFRAITNSYRLSSGNYLRINDNQISGYLDYYASKHIVFTAELGYGIFRQLQQGTGHNKNYLIDYNWADGIFIKISAAYRIRL